MIDNKRQELIHSQVMEILKENQLAFSNVARPKPTKASTATSASWSKDMAPKASAATQGAWDSTNTPGGVSSLAKEKWNVQEIAALVTKALEASNVKVAFLISQFLHQQQFPVLHSQHGRKTKTKLLVNRQQVHRAHGM